MKTLNTDTREAEAKHAMLKRHYYGMMDEAQAVPIEPSRFAEIHTLVSHAQSLNALAEYIFKNEIKPFFDRAIERFDDEITDSVLDRHFPRK